jgi:hypothetical protein
VAADDPEWLDLAKDVYRAAQTELLERWRGTRDDLIEIFKEDLREALLDLKQAVIEGRAADAGSCMKEVSMLLTELRRRSLDE